MANRRSSPPTPDISNVYIVYESGSRAVLRSNTEPRQRPRYRVPLHEPRLGSFAAPARGSGSRHGHAEDATPHRSASSEHHPPVRHRVPVAWSGWRSDEGRRRSPTGYLAVFLGTPPGRRRRHPLSCGLHGRSRTTIAGVPHVLVEVLDVDGTALSSVGISTERCPVPTASRPGTWDTVPEREGITEIR